VKISKAEEQSLRLMMSLARCGRQATLAELSEMECIPEPTVAKLLARLRRGGVVLALRGRNGGYELARPADRLDVAMVIRALGKPLLDGAGCTPADPSDSRCPNVEDCGLRSVWRHLETRIEQVLASTTLADLAQDEQQVEKHMARLWSEPRR